MFSQLPKDLKQLWLDAARELTGRCHAVPTVCPFCGVGCGLVLGVEGGRVTDVRPQAAHPVSRGQLCAKGWNAEQFLRDPERLTTAARAPRRAPRAGVAGTTPSTSRPTALRDGAATRRARTPSA